MRSLALFRVMIGLSVIGDLLDRSYDLHAHYTDMGMSVTHFFKILIFSNF